MRIDYLIFFSTGSRRLRALLFSLFFFCMIVPFVYTLLFYFLFFQKKFPGQKNNRNSYFSRPIVLLKI